MSGPNGINEQDLRRLLDIVDPAAVTPPGLELPVQVLSGLAELIPCASVDFYVMDTHRAKILCQQQLLLEDLPVDDEESDEIYFDAYWDSPYSNPERLNDHTQVTTSQDYRTREFDRSRMADYWRHMEIWHTMQVCLPPSGGHERRLILSRTASDFPFSERERLLLTLLRPHLIDIRGRVEAERRNVPRLTPRQMELLRRVARGDTNRQAARDLGMAEGTVRKHLEHIYDRLEVHSRTEAAALMATELTG